MDESGRPMTTATSAAPDTSSGQYLLGPRPSSRKRMEDPMTGRTRPDSRMGAVGGVGGGGGAGDQQQQRPGSRIAPSTSQSSSSRLQSAITSRPITSLRQGSAAGLRGSTARPPSGMSGGGGLPLHAHGPLNVVDRPVTQQGVTGVRSNRTGTSYGNRRMIHDKSYFLGLLHTKMGEINGEIQKLSTQIESLSKEQSTYITYEQRVQELATELLEMQGEMADYNLLADMIASGKTKADIEDELKVITRDNKAQAARIETIFNRRRETEKQILEYERGIQEERNRTEQLILTLSPELRHRYDAIVMENGELQKELDEQQRQLDELHATKEELYSRICTTELRRRAAQLEEEYLELCEKRDELYHDVDSLETPEQERQRLLDQIKNDNSEIATLERQLATATEEERLAQEELRGLEHDIEENDTDRQYKYRELKKKEVEMEEYIVNFDKLKQNELDTIKKVESEVAALLEKITKNQHLIAALPETGISAESFSALKEDLEASAEEFDKARYTTGMIEMRNDALKKQLENFESLEEKMRTELEQHESNMETMRVEMLKFQDTDKLRAEVSERNVRLQKENQFFDDKLKRLSEVTESTQAEFNKLKAELEGNDVHKQMGTLEKKWRLLEETNYELVTFLKEKKAATNYEQVKNNALELLSELNTSLQL